MFRLNSLTTGAVALSLALAVVWSLLACASLCTLESTVHDSRATACDTVAEANSDGVEPIEECCVCPEISSPAATMQQRETGEQILVLKAVASAVFTDIGPDTISSDRIRELPGDSPPKINAPPLYVRLLTFRI